MDTTWWIVIAVAAAVVLVALAAWAYTVEATSALQDQFGPEYDRTVDSAGSRRKAERELAEREKAHEELEIQPLGGRAEPVHGRLAARRAAVRRRPGARGPRSRQHRRAS